MINVAYDDLPNAIDNYLSKPEREINNITEQTYEVFKQYDMNPRIVDFFKQYNL